MGDEREFALVLNARYWQPCYSLLQLNPYRDTYQSLTDEMSSKNESHMGIDVEVANGVHIYVAYETISIEYYSFAKEIDKIRFYFNEVNWNKFLQAVSVDIAHLRKYYSDMYNALFYKYIDEKDRDAFRTVNVDPETSTLYFKKAYARRVGIKFIVTTPESDHEQ